MNLTILAPARVLDGVSRLPNLTGDRATVRRLELATLLLTGAVAACMSTFIDLNLRIPGHHILYSIFPMAFGFAMVPRGRAGTVMGASALTTTALLGLAGARIPGPGALTSLALTGPFLDIALRHGRSGWRLYAAFVLAGASSNIVAFMVRGATKAIFGVGGLGGGRTLANWLPQAVWTYAAAGVLCGLISAATWFKLRDRAGDGS